MSTNDNTNPLYQALSGMMSQFFRDAVACGDLAAVISAATVSSTQAPAPLPTLPVPAPTPYRSTRLALPSAALGHPASLAWGFRLQGIPIIPAVLGPVFAILLRPKYPTLTMIVLTRRALTWDLLYHLDKFAGAAAPEAQQFSPRVTHLVQAHQNAQEVVDYKNFKSAHQRYLADSGLSFDYDLPEHTAVSQILQMMATNMRTGPRRYVFGTIPSGPSTRQQHEALDLQMLAYMNLGKNRGNGNRAAHLKRESLNPALTLQELFEPDHKNQYALPKRCILNTRFVLHSIVRFSGITFVETIPGALPRAHSCLMLRQNQQFNESVEMDFDEREVVSDSSGGVPADSESESEDEDMPQAPSLVAATRPLPRPLPSRNTRAQSSSGSGSAAPPGGSVSAASPISTPALPAAGPVVSSLTSSTSISSRSATLPITPFVDPLTPSLTAVSTITLPWPATSFVPESGPYVDLFSRADIPAAIYQAAGDGALEVEGENMDGLAAAYVDKVRSAAILRDYSQLLSPLRHFNIVNPDGTLHSFGAGIENECIFTALNLFLSDSARWGLVTDEERLSLATSMPLRLASSVAPGRLLEVRVFGALISLGLISGKPPGLMSPGLLQYVLNGKKLEALTSSFVSSWHPTLYRIAREMQAVGATGSLAPFQGEIISTLGVQIATLSLRDERQHDTLVSQFVHTGILGPELHGHPETDSFANGVELPCSTGFSFSQLARSYPGGTEFYLAQAWTSFVPNASALDHFLVVTAPSVARLAPHFGTTANDLEPEVLFTGFLQRSCNPCDPATFLNAQAHIHPDVIYPTLTHPLSAPEQNDTIAVHFVLPDESNYSNTPAHSAAHMRQGTISFRSCLRVVRIPMLKLVEIYQTVGLDTFQDEFTSSDRF
ncbi:hypothetical protein C8F04DRAFT_1274583 [Mycena alexandri]|uniref:Uncharacterized protein n=1 Tax=Mycena alexandri TaxID=1745969 RepID=A0AAD6S3X3_9AGAR|nr:hypothetical protein C8F04DRAFT_1274583 [Mycena alexandri]